MQEGKSACVCSVFMVAGFEVEHQQLRKSTCCQLIITAPLCVARKLLMQVQVVKKRLKVENSVKRTEQCVGQGESSACSRPHTFLQR